MVLFQITIMGTIALIISSINLIYNVRSPFSLKNIIKATSSTSLFWIIANNLHLLHYFGFFHVSLETKR